MSWTCWADWMFAFSGTSSTMRAIAPSTSKRIVSSSVVFTAPPPVDGEAPAWHTAPVLAIGAGAHPRNGLARMG